MVPMSPDAPTNAEAAVLADQGGIKKALWRIRSRLRSCMEGKLAMEEGK